MPTGRTRKPDPIIASQATPLIFSRLRALGVDPSPLMDEYGIAPDQADAKEIELPLSLIIEITEAAARLTDDPFFGLHLGQSIHRGRYGIVEFIARSASTMRDAAERFAKNSALLNQVSAYAVEDRGEEWALTHRVHGLDVCVGRHNNEMELALWVRMCREVTQSHWVPRRVVFAHPRPEDVSELEAHFETQLEFGRGYNALVFSAADAERKVVTSDGALLEVLDGHARELIAAKPSPSDALTRIREQIRQDLKNGAPRLERVAGVLRMSARTLQRRLDDHGTQFATVVDEVRQDLATMYLDREDVPLGEVSYLLGYSDLRAFVRAYKRWTGRTPGTVRTEALKQRKKR